MKTKKRLRNEKGQMTVELVLLSIIFVSLALLIGNFIKENGLVTDLVQEPWTNRLAGMIENGVWGSSEATLGQHPNLISRHSSLRGDPAN